jgi:hypothetical protein
MFYTREELNNQDICRVTKDANITYLSKLLTEGKADYSWEVLQARGRLDAKKMVARNKIANNERGIFKFIVIGMFFMFGLPIVNIWMLFAVAFFGVIAFAYGKLTHFLMIVMIIVTWISLNSYWLTF